MADRNFQKKKRNEIKRKTKPIMLITAEGKNKTEKTKNVRFIISNPCIEVWFILHYCYTTHHFRDSKEPKREIAKYIPDYSESMDVAEILRPRLSDAKKYVEQLKEHYKSIGIKWGEVGCNPMTDVLDILLEMNVL